MKDPHDYDGRRLTRSFGGPAILTNIRIRGFAPLDYSGFAFIGRRSFYLFFGNVRRRFPQDLNNARIGFSFSYFVFLIDLNLL